MKKNPCLIVLGLITACYSVMGHADTATEIGHDWKGYNGAYCKASNNQQDVRTSLSGATNWGDSPTTIYCPVVRDDALGGSERVLVRVSLFNNNSTVGGYCRLVSRNISNSSTVDFDTVVWLSGIQDHTISLGPVDVNNWGNYMVYCSIPGTQGARKSFIRSVRVDEKI